LRTTYSLRHYESLSLFRIQRDLELPDIISLKAEIEEKLRSFYKKYLIQPVSLVFSVKTNEYLLNIDHSYVGNIVFRKFVIKIIPKHIGLSTEKILKLAAYIGQENQIISNNNFFKDYQGSDDSINSLDIFYNFFIDKVAECIRNGLINGFISNKNTSTELKGTLDINKYLISPVPKNLVHQIVKTRSPDVKINRLIKSLVLDITKKSKKSDLLIKSRAILRNLSDVSTFKLPLFFEKSDFKTNSLQRSDYEVILDLAEILINGFDPDSHEDIGFTPEYIINLDLLFEKICYFFISDTLSKDYFKVNYQSEHPHIFSELGLSGKIIPDIYLSSVNLEFKNKKVILDAKNKVSALESSFRVSTSDIYQLKYYSQVLNTKYVILLYPGTASNASKYALKGSQGDLEYKKTCLTRIRKLHENNQIVECGGTFFILWRVNLEGSLKDTKSSFNEFSNLLSEIMIDDHMFKK